MSKPPNQFIKRVLASVEGWLSFHEARYLYSLAAKGPESGQIVEIGSWKGKSTIILASASKNAGREKVYAIDPHKGGPDQQAHGYLDTNSEIDFRRNLENERVGDHVVPLVMAAEEAVRSWREPIRLLWIDGDHSYEAVKNDFQHWESFVVPGGVIAFHDTYAWEGPTRVVEELLLPSRQFSAIGFVDSISAFKKAPMGGSGPSIRSRSLLFFRHVYSLGRKHVLPGDIRKFAKNVLKLLSSPH